VQQMNCRVHHIFYHIYYYICVLFMLFTEQSSIGYSFFRYMSLSSCLTSLKLPSQPCPYRRSRACFRATYRVNVFKRFGHRCTAAVFASGRESFNPGPGSNQKAMKFSVDLSDGEYGEYDQDDVLEVPHLRDKLKSRPSPFITNNHFGGGFVSNDDRVALSALKYASAESMGAECMDLDNEEEECVFLPHYAIRAGARETIYMNPNDTKVAIVTCGGLCPGLNDVVQGLVNKCEDYGVREGNILGIQYGFRGFYDRHKKPIVLTRKNVEGIHLEGGTILGTSRGGADMNKIVKQIDIMGVDIVFVVGGNGGNAGAAAIQKACEENNVLCSVVGVPKSIDNDILLIDKCFGFDTAVEEAQRAIICAKVEASSAFNGVGIVKVMGRQSGFIALDASMSSGVVDICLIPEVPFKLEGRKGIFSYIERVLAKKGHCVICVAEGAGQDILATGENETDPSGNPILKDAGKWLRNEIKKNIKDVDMKYIDPSASLCVYWLQIHYC
jgi:6-phosphofructokinase 1